LDRLAFKKRVKEVQEALKMASSTGGDQAIKMAQNVMAGSEKLSFDGPERADDSVLPLSAMGSIKSYDI